MRQDPSKMTHLNRMQKRLKGNNYKYKILEESAVTWSTTAKLLV